MSEQLRTTWAAEIRPFLEVVAAGGGKGGALEEDGMQEVSEAAKCALEVNDAIEKCTIFLFNKSYQLLFI